MSIPLDQPVTLTFLTYSDAAHTTLADATTVVLEVLTPAGTTVTPTVVHDSLGTYHAAYTPTTAGHYAYHWHSTGTVATAADGEFDVEAKYDPQIVSLATAKGWLNDPDDTDDDEIRDVLDAATAIIEKRIGPVLPVTVTETLNARGDTLQLGRAPVISVTDASEWLGTTQYTLAAEPTGDTTVDSYGYDTDLEHGILFRRRSGYAAPWVTGTRSVTVTYVAGRNPIPADIQMAAKELVRLLWETQRGTGTGRTIPGVEIDATEDTGGLRWYRVNQLLEPYQPKGVFA